jgi:acyl dehydratase
MSTADAQTQDKLYLDDLQVGRRFLSRTHVVDETEIRAFARQFDPQPFHLDEEAAKRTIFGGLVASGWHTAAITMRLLAEGGLPLAGGIIGVGGELAWPKPTRPATRSRSRAKSWRSRPRGRGRAGARRPSATSRAISETRSCRSSPPN